LTTFKKLSNLKPFTSHYLLFTFSTTINEKRKTFNETMLSLNQFTALLKSLSDAHEQLKTFGEGDVWEIGASTPIQYPLMWVVPQPSNTAQKLLNMKFSLLFADIVFHDKSNEQDVLSDTQQIALDILAQLNAPEFADDFILDPIAQLTPFTEKFDDEVAGWKVDINIKVNYLADRCAVPSTLTPSAVSPACAPVLVRNSDGSYTASFASGSTAVLPDSVIHNSDNSWGHNLSATNSYAVPDSSITDSDGTSYSLPATKSFVAKTLQQLINAASISTIKGDLDTANKLTNFIQALTNLDLQNLTTSQLDYVVTFDYGTGTTIKQHPDRRTEQHRSSRNYFCLHPVSYQWATGKSHSLPIELYHRHFNLNANSIINRNANCQPHQYASAKPDQYAGRQPEFHTSAGIDQHPDWLFDILTNPCIIKQPTGKSDNFSVAIYTGFCNDKPVFDG